MNPCHSKRSSSSQLTLPPMLPSASTLRARVSELTVTVSHCKKLVTDTEYQLLLARQELQDWAYPVLTIPPEITAEIFLRCLPLDTRNVFNTQDAPSLLLNVCKSWREIALTTPTLWQIFHVDFHCWVRPKPSSLAELATIWLKRSRGLPLVVALLGDLATVADISAFMRALHEHSDRIISLRLCLAHPGFMQLAPFSLTFPRLGKLVLVEMNASAPSVPEVFSAPILTNVILAGTSPSAITLPWREIKTFAGKAYTLQQCLAALQLMPEVTHCTFELTKRVDAQPPDVYLHEHPQIRHLWLKDGGHMWPSQAASPHILRFLNLPALESVTIGGRINFKSAEHIFSAFFQRSASTLSRVSLHPWRGAMLDFSSTAPFLNLRIQELELGRPSSSLMDSFLTIFAQDPDFLPQLRKLTLIHNPERFHLHFLQTVETVGKRKSLATACAQEFQCLRLHWFWAPDVDLAFRAEMLGELDDLREAGLDVQIGSKLIYGA